MRRAPSKSAQLLLAHALVVALVAAPIGVFAWIVQRNHWQTAAEQRIQGVATSVASLASVKNALAAFPQTVDPASPIVGNLGETVEAIRVASGMDYIVVANPQGLRLTHPEAGNVGQRVSTDPTMPLRGEVFVGTEDGEVGRTFRVKVPVSEGNRVIGMVSAGLLESELVQQESRDVGNLAIAVGGALVVGFIAATASSYVIRRRIYGIEPTQVAPLVAELTSQRSAAEMLRANTHEFANRMHVIQGLLMQGRPDAAQQYIAQLPGAARGAPQDGEIMGEPLLDAVLAAKRALAREGGKRLELDPESDATGLTFTIGDDEVTVLSNLISNALEAGESVSVGVFGDDQELHIAVADDGPGVEPDLDVLRRGVSTKHGDRGVGLALVAQIVERRGGELRFGEGALGGAEFEVLLPGPAFRQRL
ncbi:Spo0B domain-containing protein [Micrococcales bacterium 31B]|nr:Spo0B domain-containing protein [Micrococcales bacterium 31B]